MFDNLNDYDWMPEMTKFLYEMNPNYVKQYTDGPWVDVDDNEITDPEFVKEAMRTHQKNLEAYGRVTSYLATQAIAPGVAPPEDGPGASPVDWRVPAIPEPENVFHDAAGEVGPRRKNNNDDNVKREPVIPPENPNANPAQPNLDLPIDQIGGTPANSIEESSESESSVDETFDNTPALKADPVASAAITQTNQVVTHAFESVVDATRALPHAYDQSQVVQRAIQNSAAQISIGSETLLNRNALPNEVFQSSKTLSNFAPRHKTIAANNVTARLALETTNLSIDLTLNPALKNLTQETKKQLRVTTEQRKSLEYKATPKRRLAEKKKETTALPAPQQTNTNAPPQQQAQEQSPAIEAPTPQPAIQAQPPPQLAIEAQPAEQMAIEAPPVINALPMPKELEDMRAQLTDKDRQVDALIQQFQSLRGLFDQNKRMLEMVSANGNVYRAQLLALSRNLQANARDYTASLGQPDPTRAIQFDLPDVTDMTLAQSIGGLITRFEGSIQTIQNTISQATRFQVDEYQRAITNEKEQSRQLALENNTLKDRVLALGNEKDQAIGRMKALETDVGNSGKKMLEYESRIGELTKMIEVIPQETQRALEGVREETRRALTEDFDNRMKSLTVDKETIVKEKLMLENDRAKLSLELEGSRLKVEDITQRYTELLTSFENREQFIKNVEAQVQQNKLEYDRMKERTLQYDQMTAMVQRQKDTIVQLEKETAIAASLRINHESLTRKAIEMEQSNKTIQENLQQANNLIKVLSVNKNIMDTSRAMDSLRNEVRELRFLALEADSDTRSKVAEGLTHVASSILSEYQDKANQGDAGAITLISDVTEATNAAINECKDITKFENGLARVTNAAARATLDNSEGVRQFIIDISEATVQGDLGNFDKLLGMMRTATDPLSKAFNGRMDHMFMSMMHSMEKAAGGDPKKMEVVTRIRTELGQKRRDMQVQNTNKLIDVMGKIQKELSKDPDTIAQEQQEKNDQLKLNMYKGFAEVFMHNMLGNLTEMTTASKQLGLSSQMDERELVSNLKNISDVIDTPMGMMTDAESGVETFDIDFNRANAVKIGYSEAYANIKDIDWHGVGSDVNGLGDMMRRLTESIDVNADGDMTISTEVEEKASVWASRLNLREDQYEASHDTLTQAKKYNEMDPEDADRVKYIHATLRELREYTEDVAVATHTMWQAGAVETFETEVLPAILRIYTRESADALLKKWNSGDSKFDLMQQIYGHMKQLVVSAKLLNHRMSKK